MDWNFVPFSGGPRVCLGRKFVPNMPISSHTDISNRAIRPDGGWLLDCAYAPEV